MRRVFFSAQQLNKFFEETKIFKFLKYIEGRDHLDRNFKYIEGRDNLDRNFKYIKGRDNLDRNFRYIEGRDNLDRNFKYIEGRDNLDRNFKIYSTQSFSQLHIGKLTFNQFILYPIKMESN